MSKKKFTWKIVRELLKEFGSIPIIDFDTFPRGEYLVEINQRFGIWVIRHCGPYIKKKTSESVVVSKR